MTLVHLLMCCNKKHPKTWDENLIYIQHSYNKVAHTSINKFPFETYFGYLFPLPLDVVYGQQAGVKEGITKDALKE
jgi:hypothetical protein